MGTIRVLPPTVADKVAAGEVVERPASVVKELVENAIDAQAYDVCVEIEGDGCDLIRVTDDGCAMEPDDLEKAILRHATSKIATLDDLFAVTTLGFRGEALPSIVSVSRTLIASRPSAAEHGWCVVVEGGEVVKRKPRGMKPGTVIEVRDLFFNTPARKKFLKTAATEQRNVIDVMTRFALAYPEVRFLLTLNGRSVLDLPRAADVSRRCAALLGRDLAGRMTSLDRRVPGVSVRGIVSPIGETRRNRSGIYLFVNRRPVRDAMLSSALIDGYAGSTVRGAYPVAVLFVDVDPRDVDVNVHPAKAEVRFKNPRAVFALVSSAVRGAIGGAPRRPPNETVTPVAVCEEHESYAPEGGHTGIHPPRTRDAGGEQVPAGSEPLTFLEDPRHDAGEFLYASLSYLGTLHATYILLFDSEAMYILDMHAAHERVTYERLRHAAGAGRVPSQILLEPLLVEVTPREYEAFGEAKESLDRLGFVCDDFGGRTLAVRSVPEVLVGGDVRQALQNLLHVAAEGEFRGGREALDLEARLAEISCRTSVRSGRTLSPAEVLRLLEDLDAAGSPRTCPHGRPLFRRITRTEIERWLKRSV